MSQRVSSLVIASVAFAAALIAARVMATGHLQFFFLFWNLFLAVIPLALSRGLRHLPKPGWLALVVGGTWLLFFPNAPYLLTDLVHLKARPQAPFWYDLVLLLAAAWSGVLVGMVSLADVHTTVRRWYGARIGWAVALAALILGSFGIYLGRFLRWNSWEVLTEPRALLADVVAPVLDPLGHPKAVGITVLFSVLLTLCYLALRPLAEAEPRRAEAEPRRADWEPSGIRR
ncbi:MAG: DUF1361 domain-containing protein [Bacteroidota bacterium]